MKRCLIPLLLTCALLVTGCSCGGSQPQPTAQPTPQVVNPTATPMPGSAEWAYRLQGHITPSEECGYLADYQMKLTVHYGAGTSEGADVYLNGSSQEDFDDIRFTSSYGVRLLSHWIQDYTPGVNATVWVKFDYISSEGADFYLYYGNPAAKSASDGYGTFLIFNDGSSMEGWRKCSGGRDFDWSATGDVIRCTSNNFGWSNLYYGDSLGSTSYIIESKIRAQDSNTSDHYQHGVGCSYNNPMARWLEDGDYWQIRDPHSTNSSDPDATFNAAQWHDYTFVRDNDVWQLIVDGDLKVTHESGSANRCAGMYVYMEHSGHWVEFDDFRVRNFCQPEPVWGPWSAETNEAALQTTAGVEPEREATPTPETTAPAEATPTPETTQTSEPVSTVPPITTPQP